MYSQPSLISMDPCWSFQRNWKLKRSLLHPSVYNNYDLHFANITTLEFPGSTVTKVFLLVTKVFPLITKVLSLVTKIVTYAYIRTDGQCTLLFKIIIRIVWWKHFCREWKMLQISISTQEGTLCKRESCKPTCVRSAGFVSSGEMARWMMGASCRAWEETGPATLPMLPHPAHHAPDTTSSCLS